MSVVSDLLMIGAIGAVGLYLYNNNKGVKDAVDDSGEILNNTLLPSTVDKTEFNKTVNKVRDDAGLDPLPQGITDIVKPVLNPGSPLVNVTQDTIKTYVDNSGYNGKEQLELLTGTNNLSPIDKASTLVNAASTTAKILDDVVSGKWEWTGFKNPFA